MRVESLKPGQGYIRLPEFAEAESSTGCAFLHFLVGCRHGQPDAPTVRKYPLLLCFGVFRQISDLAIGFRNPALHLPRP